MIFISIRFFSYNFQEVFKSIVQSYSKKSYKKLYLFYINISLYNLPIQLGFIFYKSWTFLTGSSLYELDSHNWFISI